MNTSKVNSLHGGVMNSSNINFRMSQSERKVTAVAAFPVWDLLLLNGRYIWTELTTYTFTILADSTTGYCSKHLSKTHWNEKYGNFIIVSNVSLSGGELKNLSFTANQ